MIIIKPNKIVVNLDNISKYMLLLYICTTFVFNEYRLYAEILYILTLGLYFICKRKTWSIYTIWNIFFVGMCMLSSLWTVTPNNTYRGIRSVIEIAIIGNLLIAFIDNKDKVIYLYKSLIIAGNLLIIRLILITPLEAWGTQRLGGEVINSNSLGLYLTISAICAMQLAQINKNKKYYWLIPMYFIIVALTGSRKAFVMFVVGIVGLHFLNERKISKKILYIPISIAILVIGYNVVMNVPELYEVLGYRLEGLIGMVTGNGEFDNSAYVRFSMIDRGIELFKEKPFLGYGLASYSSISGYGMYSHNNYIELMVGIGGIGMCIYYSIYTYIIIKILNSKQLIGNGLLIIISLLAIIEIGAVNYYDESFQLIIAMAVATINYCKNSRKTSEGEKNEYTKNSDKIFMQSCYNYKLFRN